VLAEPALELLQSSRPGDGDLIDDPDWLAQALRRWGLGGERVDPAALKRLREAMRGVVAIIDSGRLPANEELSVLNEYIGGVPVVARLERHGDGFLVDMTPQATGTELVTRELAGWFATLLRSDPWRLKLCANPECRLPFYDASKSRTRRWHDNATCGNRERVRRFRERHHAP
jgi:predicted RNA-binding Zn ribbon-like protein